MPDSPYDVMGTWTDKNDLNISWNHPNATNGKIKNFTVTIANGKNKPILFLKEVKSEEDYNLTYSYLVRIC